MDNNNNKVYENLYMVKRQFVVIKDISIGYKKEMLNVFISNLLNEFLNERKFAEKVFDLDEHEFEKMRPLISVVKCMALGDVAYDKYWVEISMN